MAPDAELELRKLRLYNWQLFRLYRGHAQRIDAGLERARVVRADRVKNYLMKADRALRVVQALNAVLTGTAEQDAKELGEVTW